MECTYFAIDGLDEPVGWKRCRKDEAKFSNTGRKTDVGRSSNRPLNPTFKVVA